MTPGGEATSGSAQAQLLLIPAESAAHSLLPRGGRAEAKVGGEKVMKIILTCFPVG